MRLKRYRAVRLEEFETTPQPYRSARWEASARFGEGAAPSRQRGGAGSARRPGLRPRLSLERAQIGQECAFTAHADTWDDEPATRGLGPCTAPCDTMPCRCPGPRTKFLTAADGTRMTAKPGSDGWPRPVLHHPCLRGPEPGEHGTPVFGAHSCAAQHTGRREVSRAGRYRLSQRRPPRPPPPCGLTAPPLLGAPPDRICGARPGCPPPDRICGEWAVGLAPPPLLICCAPPPGGPLGARFTLAPAGFPEPPAEPPGRLEAPPGLPGPPS